MPDRTTLLFALPGFRVLDVTVDPDGGRQVLVESEDLEGGCPSCSVLSALIKDRPISRVKDVPHGTTPLRVRVRKRRFCCAETACPRRSFTEVTGQLPARARVTARLRERVCTAVTTTNRAVSEVAAEYGLAWPTVHKTLVVKAAEVLGQAAPTTAIGVDETRSRRVRWQREEAGWRRTDPWLTSIVDLAGLGGIIGLAAGRSGACLSGWLGLQTQDFRGAVQVVAIDPSAPYAAAIRRELPAATVVVDHFHLIMLANQSAVPRPARVLALERDLLDFQRGFLI